MTRNLRAVWQALKEGAARLNRLLAEQDDGTDMVFQTRFPPLETPAPGPLPALHRESHGRRE